MKKLFSKLFNILRQILFQFCPFIDLYIANKKIRKKRKNTDQDELDKLNTNQIEDLIKSELDRKKVIDDKSKANLFAISISASFMVGISTFILKEENIELIITSCIFVKVTLFIFISGVIYLVLGGLLSLASLRVKEIGTITKDNMVKKNSNEKEYKIEVLKSINKTQLNLLESTNNLEASYITIRNGIFLFTIGLILFLIKILT